jgi:GNAT superfamily N-acetyltransferase
MQTLNRSCFSNLLAFWSGITKATHGKIIHQPNLLCTLSGIHSPVYNAIFQCEFEKYENVKKELSHHTAIKSYPISVWVPENQHHGEWLNGFKELNYFGYVPMMAISTATEISSELASEIEIIQHQNCNTLSDWMRPLCKAFHFEDAVAKQVQHALEIMSASFQHFAAVHEGKIIATASVFLEGDVPGLYNLAVLPEFRNRGIATALHQARLNFLRTTGYTYATLQATPMAAELDKRIGFKELGGFHIYFDEV